jgi:GNAT superfamily N-acetyltransferase
LEKNIFINRNDKVSSIELNELFLTNNWDIKPIEKIDKSLLLSWGWIAARTNENRLVGFVQVLSDEIMHAYIFRMIVHPEFRNQGIGTAIMEELMKILKENNLKPALVASPGRSSFYEKFGFSIDPKGCTAMCIR